MRLEHMVHEVLEGCWGISEPESHHKHFEMSKLTIEPCLWYVCWINSNLVVSSIKVNFGEILCIFELVDKLRNEGKWVDIFDSCFVEGSIVNA